MLIQATLSDPSPLASGIVHCTVTSPPYYGLRAYDIPPQIWGGQRECEHVWIYSTRKGQSGGKKSSKVQIKGSENFQIVPDTTNAICEKCGAWYGHLGLEPSVEMFIEHLVRIFDDVRRVLRDDGVLFVNLGDSYAGSGGPGSQYDNKTSGKYKTKFQKYLNPNRAVQDLANLNKIGVPFLFVLAMQEAGWIWRQEIIWAKGISFNPAWSGSVMPESVDGWRWERHKRRVDGQYQDCPGCEKCNPNNGYVLRKGSWRPTTAHEYIFMFTKTDNYYCDREAVKEALAVPDAKGMKFGGNKKANGDNPKYSGDEYDASELNGRNLRSVWTISPKGYKGEHFAAYGDNLVEPLIKVATSERGVCPHCGCQWARVIRKEFVPQPDVSAERGIKGTKGQKVLYDEKFQGTPRGTNAIETVDWWPTCDCPEHTPVPALVWDPFIGSGTTGLAAQALGRKWVGTDVGMGYLLQARERTGMKALDEWANGIKGETEITDLPLFANL